VEHRQYPPDLARTRASHRGADLRLSLEGQSYSAAVKAACRLAGDTTGPVRAPLLELDDAATAELAAPLEHATHTTVAS
jgi:dihydrodipicolinate synthase/N-acetylneuraminate lyase